MLPQVVLIVDDEPVIRYTTGILLKKHGISMLEAEGGEQGLEIARKQQPDLILLDIMMPGSDGWDVLKELNSDSATASIPVVLFSAGDYSDNERKANECGGVHAILRKPFQMEALLEACDLGEE